MKKLLFLFLSASISVALFSQNVGKSKSTDLYKISTRAGSKILSGKLVENILYPGKSPSDNLKCTQTSTIRVILYFEGYPSADQVRELENLGVNLFLNTWTPPVENHPYGFLIASIPLENIENILALSSVKKIDSAERSNKAMNNNASLSINAPMVWGKGVTGKGSTICILDSGIDTTYKGSDLPVSFESKDYSYFPLLDDNVANKATGHGTHVSATALGRGVLSDGQNHINNGKGSFKGMAPGADLVFLKIGQDEDAVAEDPSIIAAIDAAINIYHADIISMSYGGWDDYHDGSSALDQKVDWAYHQGVPFFCSAGNQAENDKHWMGTIAANSESDFIEVQVSEPNGDTTMLRFNMVWADGTKRTDLSIQYFDVSKNPLSNVIVLPATEGFNGTESMYSYYNLPLSSAGTFYLKVANHSNQAQEVHLYEDWGNLRIGTDHVRFTDAEPSYTIGSPSSALHAFAVGAYVSRTIWTDPEDDSYWWGASSVINHIAPFSSVGPTIDQRIKPDICAPGSAILSLRDKDYYKTRNSSWIDNDGIAGGEANYYCMRGTSMACPVVAGAAALYLEKYPDASPRQIYDAMKKFSNQSELSNIPDNTWGYGKLDIDCAMQGIRDVFTINGDMSEEKYETLASFTSGRNGYGNDNTLGELKYYSDGENLYIGITGEVTGDDNILLFMDFSGVQGRGTQTLGGGNSGDFVNCAFSYIGNVTMDFDVDFALGFNEGNSTRFEFFIDAIRYGAANKAANIGQTNQMGASSNFEIGDVFGGSGFMTVAYDSSYSANQKKGVEVKIPVSAFAGVDTSQTLRLFAVISSITGDVSNECIPGDPGSGNLGDGANFAAIFGQDFFTQPVGIHGPQPTTFVLSNESPGYLIDQLVAKGYGDSCLYAVLKILQPLSGGAITGEFMEILAARPAGSEIFTTSLNTFTGETMNPVGINSDGTFIVLDVFGIDFYDKTGYASYPEITTGPGNEIVTYALNPQYYINTGENTDNSDSDNYYAFAIAWSAGISVSATAVNIAGTAGSKATFDITTGGNWTADSDQEWLTVDPTSGTGDATVTLTADANTTPEERIAHVTLSMLDRVVKTITVTQAGSTTDNISTNDAGSLYFFPNPAKNGFTINAGAQSTKLAIHDLNGRLLLTQQVKGETYVNISSLAPGMYLLEVNGENLKLVKR
jgi:subtilisin family serine protease